MKYQKKNWCVLLYFQFWKLALIYSHTIICVKNFACFQFIFDSQMKQKQKIKINTSDSNIFLWKNIFIMWYQIIYGITWCDTIWYDMISWSTISYHVVSHYVIWCNMISHHITYSLIWYGIALYYTICTIL